MVNRDSVQIARYIRILRGGSQPVLVQASDGLFYAVKFKNNLQGANILLNEAAGTELFRACGLASVPWKPLLLTPDFVDKNPDCWMRTPTGVLRPEPGLCFGSRFLGASGLRPLEILPGAYFSRVRNRMSFWLARVVDICAQHADNRQALFVEDAEGWLDAFFIDHGHLFGGPKGCAQPDLKASAYLDSRIYADVLSNELEGFLQLPRTLNTDDLWQLVNALPADWKTKSALLGFEQCLNRLANENLLRNVMDSVVDTERRRTGFERNRTRNQFENRSALLHDRIPPQPVRIHDCGSYWSSCSAVG
ncbi:MAG: hypothetical protein ABR906_11005 [Terracidiphilus sp.]|jgi:hypothetical protein